MSEQAEFPVLLRGFRDEPAVATVVGRWMCGKSDVALQIYGKDPAKLSGWNPFWAYELDAPQYQELRDAFERGDTDSLSVAWNRAKRFDLTRLPWVEVRK